MISGDRRKAHLDHGQEGGVRGGLLGSGSLGSGLDGSHCCCCCLVLGVGGVSQETSRLSTMTHASIGSDMTATYQRQGKVGG